MPDREAFLRTICDTPDEDGPRLVYADWLEEQGDPRGEFIRLQCERLHLRQDADRARHAKREDELLKDHGQTWREELPRLPGIEWGPFQRGLVYLVKADTATRFLQHAPEIFATGPVNEVWFTGLDAAGASMLAESEYLLRLRLLKNYGQPTGDEGVAALANSPNSANLRWLLLNGNNIGDAGARAIARSPYLKKLELLFLHNNRIGDAGARALAESKRLPNLTRIYMVQNELHEPGIALLRARWGENAFV